MTLTLNAHKEICAIHKSGKVALSPEQMVRCVQVAQVKVAEIAEAIASHLDQAAGPRKGALPSRQGPKVIGENIACTATPHAVDVALQSGMEGAGQAKGGSAADASDSEEEPITLAGR
eukprot:comp17656_c0_seq3/m.17444 comp17656_c0_seq3/g.17444  ORF comp17656_c0_seq3/g.17444 comp17656_c0_seq3/m.17444 type:complete len:118 (-) comp17656_c0_seq3:466-819(-)